MIYLFYYTDQTIDAILAEYGATDLQSLLDGGVFYRIDEADGRRLVTLQILPEDSSYRYRAIMERPQLNLKFTLPIFIEIPIGAWTEFQDQTFYLNNPENIRKSGTRIIEYTLVMGTEEDALTMYKIHNMVDHRLKFSMCAKPHEFVQMVVDNLNERLGSNTWSVGDYIEANEKTIEFNHVYSSDALATIASEFETEYEIDSSFNIHLHKVERKKDNPLPLSYGRGNGFVPGVGRSSQGKDAPIKRLYVQGGSRNIDRSKYGGQDSDYPQYTLSSADLLLPASQTIGYDGEKFSDQDGFNEDSAHWYVTDADGYYVERSSSDPNANAVLEDSLDCPDIYPSRIGHATDVRERDRQNNFYDFYDDTLPDGFDFNDYVILDEKMTVIFQSGMLAGREFEVIFSPDPKRLINGEVLPGKRFEIVPQEIDGIMMPNEQFCPSSANGGDEYAIFHIMLPKGYVCDDEHKAGASWDMFREAVKHLWEHEEQKFTFTGELQGIWAKQHWTQVQQYMYPGAYVHFSDSQFARNGVDIRIVGIKDYVNKPHSPVIEISNDTVTASSVNTALSQIANTEIYVEQAKTESMNYTRRRYRDVRETMEMLSGAVNSLSGQYTSAINPLMVSTMQMLVGDEALQFRFVDSPTTLIQIDNPIRYDAPTNTVNCLTGYLQHMTIGIDQSVLTAHSPEEYRVWHIPGYSLFIDDPTKKYYVYAIVNKSLETGHYKMSEDPLDFEGETTYNLLCGVLNSEHEGTRSYVSLYGYTEILPGRITTDSIVSASGDSWFDLVGESFRLGDKLSFMNGVLRLKGAIMQSPSGNESPLPVYRGQFEITNTYYPGDVVSFELDGVTSTYICTQECSYVLPTSSSCWSIYAKGAKGDTGASPTSVYRGLYDPGSVYYGNPSRLDIVKYGEAWYVAKYDAPNGSTGFSGHLPTDPQYWSPFGAQFSSVATNLMLAEMADVGGWVFSNGKLWSHDGGCFLDGQTGNIATTGIILRKMTVITEDNIEDYITEIPVDNVTLRMLNLMKAGSLIKVDYYDANASFSLPSFSMSENVSRDVRDNARSYVGSRFTIYNNTDNEIIVTGHCVLDDDQVSFQSYLVPSHTMADYECKLRFREGREEVYWLCRQGLFVD